MKTFTPKDKILIVGGTGFIGKHLANRCTRDTKHVTCIGLGTNKTHVIKDHEIVYADITNKEQLTDILLSGCFNYVFNLGGYINHIPYFNGGRHLIDSHFNGLLNLIDSIDRKCLKSFVQIGSSDEYGNAPSPQREDMRNEPISPYSLAKVASTHLIETISKTENFPGVVLRLFLVYGPGQDEKRFLPQIIKSCLKNKEFKTSDGKQLRDFCFVDDVVEAMVTVALCPESFGRTINIASGVPIAIREIVGKVVLLTGGGKPLWSTHPYRSGENMSLYADISLAQRFLKWNPTISLEDGLQKTINYYKHYMEIEKS